MQALNSLLFLLCETHVANYDIQFKTDNLGSLSFLLTNGISFLLTCSSVLFALIQRTENIDQFSSHNI